MNGYYVTVSNTKTKKLEETQGCFPDFADEAWENKAGQCWGSPQEMAEQINLPHGFVDLCGEGENAFTRIWHGTQKVWLNTYFTVLPC